MPEKNISKEEIRKVSQLARIEISQKEEEKFAKEINSILEYFKDLSQVDVMETGGFDHYCLQENKFREDEVENLQEEAKEGIRKLFPEREGNYLKVKAVLTGK